MAEGIGDCMPLALRSVGDAIRLDSEKRTKEAYCQYLSCVIYISQVLKDDAWDKDLQQVYNSDTAKLFRLLQQCQERALTIISTGTLANNAPITHQKPETQKSQHLQPSSEGVHQRYSDSSVVNTGQSDQSHLAPQSGAPHKLSDTTAPGSTLSAPSTDAYLHLPSPPSSPMPHHRRTGSYHDPLEKAYQENKHLIAAYRTRMQNSNKGRRNQDVMSKNLSLMRRMSENLVIAKAREEAIKKKLLERQQRLQEETNRRFGPAVLSTKEQQEQRILYTKILEFEQETVWPKHLREKLKLMPTNAKLIKEMITKIFCSADHPLTQFLLQYQYYVYRKLAPLVKDVGFPDAKSGRTAATKGAYTALSEIHADQQPTETRDSVHVDESVRGNQEEDTSSPRQAEDVENPLSECNIAGTLTDTEEVEEEKCEEEEHSVVENHELAPDGGEENVGTNVDCEGVSSSTDLGKLKNLLVEEAPPGTSETKNGKVNAPRDEQDSSAVEGTDESANLEIYFQELEDDMFGWESNGDENDDSDKESNVADSSREIANEKSLCENKEDSNTELQESRNEDLEEPKRVSDKASSSDLDPLKGKEENSSDETNTDDTHSPEQIEPLREKDDEPENIDTNNGSQLADDESPSETNQFTLSHEEHDANGQTTSSNIDDEGEVQQIETITNDATPNINSNEDASQAPGSVETPETPDEEQEIVVEIDSQGETQVPRLPLFEESSDNSENDSKTVPPTDEVRKQLKDILVDLRFFLEKLQELLILAYEPLDTPAGRDLCYSCVEFPFFKPLWPMLLAVLRQVNFDKEVCLADVMSANISKGPLDLGVPPRLCMDDQEVLDSMGNKYPYHLAVEELHKVVTLFCPLEKLECIVRTSRCICQCVEDYWENKGKPRHSPETAIGCDDLLPILSFVIIRSGMAQLVSECDAMEEFIPEGYLMGEEGYCLTTLLTALAYLATLKPT